MSCFIGIDNGMKGGLAVIGDHPGNALIASLRMPIDKATRQVNIYRILQWLDSLHIRIYSIGIESPCHRMKKIQSMRSLAINYGLLLGALRARYRADGVWIKEVPAHSSTSWQRTMLGKVPQGETKKYALEAARKIWPAETFVQPRCTTPHDGIIDAALIAEYLRREVKVIL